MSPLDVSPPSPRLRGEGRGEGQPQTSAQTPAPHPSPLPTKRWGEGTDAAPLGEPDPAGTIWHNGAFRRDKWTKVDTTSPLPEGAIILPKKRWLAEREALVGRNAPLGLLIGAGETVDDIVDNLPRFALIALDFPKFSDGRAFSTARLLREKYGYAGELRAVGDVLADPIPFMRRVGFDSFEVTNGPTRRALTEGRIAEVKLHYQPVGATEPPAGTRPWLRRTKA